MRETTGDLWRFYGMPGYVVLITTNGFVKYNGCAVMGRGCARQAKDRFPDIDRELGKKIVEHGNIPIWLGSFMQLMSFPVKHNWWEKADPELIKKSALILKQFANSMKRTVFVLPRPGCGNGHLDWETEVKPVLLDLEMPDNVWVISPGKV